MDQQKEMLNQGGLKYLLETKVPFSYKKIKALNNDNFYLNEYDMGSYLEGCDIHKTYSINFYKILSNFKMYKHYRNTITKGYGPLQTYYENYNTSGKYKNNNKNIYLILNKINTLGYLRIYNMMESADDIEDIYEDDKYYEYYGFTTFDNVNLVRYKSINTDHSYMPYLIDNYINIASKELNLKTPTELLKLKYTLNTSKDEIKRDLKYNSSSELDSNKEFFINEHNIFKENNLKIETNKTRSNCLWWINMHMLEDNTFDINTTPNIKFNNFNNIVNRYLFYVWMYSYTHSLYKNVAICEKYYIQNIDKLNKNMEELCFYINVSEECLDYLYTFFNKHKPINVTIDYSLIIKTYKLIKAVNNKNFYKIDIINQYLYLPDLYKKCFLSSLLVSNSEYITNPFENFTSLFPKIVTSIKDTNIDKVTTIYQHDLFSICGIEYNENIPLYPFKNPSPLPETYSYSLIYYYSSIVIHTNDNQLLDFFAFSKATPKFKAMNKNYFSHKIIL